MMKSGPNSEQNKLYSNTVTIPDVEDVMEYFILI